MNTNANRRHGCPQRRVLSAFAAGRLAGQLHESVDRHVRLCEDCRKLVSSMQHSEGSRETTAHPGDRERSTVAESAAPTVIRQTARADAGSSAAQRPADLPHVGNYQALRLIGRGGMGSVYEAIHSELEKFVALKVLAPGHLDDEAAVTRFRREMRAVGRLDHPNIVRAMDAGTADDTHFLAMELVYGLDLDAVIRRVGLISEADACEIVRQSALALGHADQHGLVHRDVKPSNIMLALDAREKLPVDSDLTADWIPPSLSDWLLQQSVVVKVMDMGLARLTEPPLAGELTTSGEIVGTISYIAPEQVNNTGDVDIRADIYALGATMYRMLSGRTPYSDSASGGTLEQLKAISYEAIPRIDLIRPGLSPAVVQLVHQMLERDPADRIQTPDELVAAAEPLTRGHDLPRLLVRAWASQGDAPTDRASADQTVSAKATSDTPTSIETKSSGGRRLATIGALAVAAITLAGFAYWLGGRSTTPPVAETRSSPRAETRSSPRAETRSSPTVETNDDRGERDRGERDVGDRGMVTASSGDGDGAVVGNLANVDRSAPRTIEVTPRGTGDTSSLAEALAMARPGDTIDMQIGVYESDQGQDYVVSTPGLTILGNRSRLNSAIIITATDLTVDSLRYWSSHPKGDDLQLEFRNCRARQIDLGYSGGTIKLFNCVTQIRGGYNVDVDIEHCTLIDGTSVESDQKDQNELLSAGNYSILNSILVGDSSAFTTYDDPPKQAIFNRCLIYAKEDRFRLVRNDQDVPDDLEQRKSELLPLDKSGSFNIEMIRCITGRDPKFMQWDSYWSSSYHLQEDSPAIGAGTDGKNLGALADEYGWPLNFVDYSQFFESGPSDESSQ